MIQFGGTFRNIMRSEKTRKNYFFPVDQGK